MNAVAEHSRLRRLGLILDRTRPVQITKIEFSEHDRQSFTAARVAGVLRGRFPDLSDAKLIQVIAAFLGQPPMQVQEINFGGDLDHAARRLEPAPPAVPSVPPAAPPPEREHLSKHDLKVLKPIPEPDAAHRTA
jgi:hypothetical protein